MWTPPCSRISLCIYARVSHQGRRVCHKKKLTAVSTLPGRTAMDTILPSSSVANVLITKHERDRRPNCWYSGVVLPIQRIHGGLARIVGAPTRDTTDGGT